MKLQRNIALNIGLTLIALAALACGKVDNSTPTQTFQTFYNAVKSKDTKTIKSLMQSKELAGIEKEMKVKNKSVEDWLTENMNEMASDLPEKMPETRNEKIEGDEATLEAKDAKQDKWRTVSFKKESDGWKINL